jgi:hypothetical protein
MASLVRGSHVQFVDALRRALGIPQHIRGLTLRAYVNEAVTVEVESYLETSQDEAVTGVIERFELNPEMKAEGEYGTESPPGPKRYLLFAWRDGQARGGWLDLRVASDHYERARDAAKNLGREWQWHIIDAHTGEQRVHTCDA